MKQNLLFNQASALCKTLGKRLTMVLTMLLTVSIGQAWGAEETATLSFADKAQRTSFSTTKQVWEQNGVTFTNDKASSTNNVADYAAPVRLYANSSVTVACSFGNMTKIVFDCSSDSYATAMKNSIGNAATATSDKVTVTLDGTSKTFTVAKLTAQVRLEAITVTYEEGSSTVSVTSVTLNKTELDLIVDATEQLTATVLPNDATNKNVSWSSNNTAVATVNNGLVTAVAAGNATITVTTEDGNKTATCTISVTAPAGGDDDGDCEYVWELVTDDTTLQPLDKVIITASGDNEYALSTNQKSSNREATEITKNEDLLENPSADVQILTLVEVPGSTGVFAFLAEGVGYLYAASTTNNQLKTKIALDDNGKWTIKISEGIASIVATASSNRNVMQFNPNNGSPIFACYSSASQTSLAIYKKVCITEPTYTLTLHSGLSCVKDGSATVELNATELTNFTPATRDGFTCSGYWSAPSGGVKVLNADGTFAATSVQEYITDGKWTNEGNVTLTPRWECSNTMTLSVGTQSGGTYSLSKTSLETCDCTDDKRQVTITATPNSGYSVTDISYSGDGTATKVSGPTVNGNDTEWVYQFNQGDNGTGTFTVTFTTIPTYTITLDAGSGTCDDESLTETSGGAGVTLPTANPPAACATDGWEFAGWWTASVAETTTSPGELLTAGSNYKPTTNCTLYAVYSYTEAGGGDSNVTFDFSNIASANSWTNGTAYTTVTISPITINAIGGGNNGKYYTSNTSWRMYNGGSLQISTEIGKITSVSSSPSKTFTINDEGTATLSFSATTEFKSITVFYSSTTTTYNSNPTCLVPVWEGATIDKTALAVNCGERSSMDGAAKITFSKDKIFGFSNPITIEASEGFLVSTSRTPNENYQQSVSQSPLVGTEHPNTFNGKFVYVRAEAPAMSEEDLSGTITIKNNKGETLQTITVTADVTCNKCTVQFVDRGANYQEPILLYAGETIDEAPADPEGVCTDPIHYVFDGWAEATVDEGATTYTKVTFPYTVTGNTKFYAVYRYLDDGGEPSNDFIKVTKEKDDWTGDYVIVDEDAEKAIGNAYQNTNTLTAVDVTIQDNKVVSPSEAVIWQIRKHGENYTMYNASANKYAYIAKTDAKGAGLSATTTNTTQDIQIIFNNGTAKVSGVDIYRCFYYYGTNTEWRTYATGSYNTGALYCRSLESYLYTTSPVCGPHLAITEGKDIYVTGGNAGGTRDLVIAQQKVSYKATRLQTSNGLADGTAPDVKVATNGITVGGVVTQDVKVTIDQTKEQQTDGTYTITGTITVQYQPSANNKQEDIQVQLAVDYNAEARDNFTVHARSLPAEFVIVAKSGDKWYALNGDMNTNAANPANGQVTLDNDDNPTKATYAPCNTIYTFDGLPNTGDRTYVRFQGTDGAWLWSSSGTNTGIQNNVLKTTPEGNNNAYNWKLYTEDNITYRFGNANSSRQLTLNGGKFGMYTSGVQDIRILPYEAKCLYNYAPSNLKVSVLKGTYVTLTWDAVAGATKYQYSTNGTTWTDCGTEPTVTINDLEGATEYIYYIRAHHEDAGVSQECIDYAEITFTTADCDDVPTDITYSADLNSITVSWTAAAQTATIKYNIKEDGTGGGGIINNATSPYKISGGLDKNTTYYIQILSDGTCASPIIPVKTEDVEVDIVEWYPQGIIVDINTDETIGVTLENEVSYGTGVGVEATELFFSKYYEATGNVKLVAVYNGTKNIIDLTNYTIQYGKTSWESNYITLKDFGTIKGQIQPGEEIILYSMQEKNAEDDKEIMDCVHEQYPDGAWVKVTASNNEGGGNLQFGGDKTIILCETRYDETDGEYYDYILDVIGALTDDFLPDPSATEEPSWGDKEGWVCETGLSIADDSQIGISTNRCLLIRNNTVTSGENAVASNINDFVTLCTEWKGAHVPDDANDNGVQASCDNFAYVGTFDYSDYYTKYVSMGDERVFDEQARNADGTVTIPIEDLYKHACSNIRVKLTNSNSEVLSDREYKVPIMITTTQGTNGQAFLDLQQNLATKEVDDKGTVIGIHPLSLDEVREICKTCDVVVRDNATLTKVTDGTENDHPQVHDVIVYEGASIVIPDGDDHNYTINSLSLRRKGDEVASAQVQGTGKFVLPADVPVTLSMRIDANNWHWFTLPYDCDIADVIWSDGTEAKYNTDWFLMYYDGESRSNQKSNYESHWKVYNGTTIEAGKGYIIGITGDLAHPNYTFELRFPMAQEVLAAEQTDKTVAVNAWGVKKDIRSNHKGWNLVGNPYLNYYKTADEYSLAGLPLIEYTDIDPVTGEWNYENRGSVPYVVTPIDGGWYEYQQELASEVNMMPFTAYFVQVGDPNTHENGQALNASFEASNRGKKSTLHRAPSEVDEQEEPAIVAISLTNAKGESDKTTLLIADRFTNEYEMNADFFKWFGDYYTYYTKPVLYTIGADNESRAFNALNEELAAQPVALGMYAAQTGNYTFSLHERSNLTGVAEVWLHDASNNTYTNLLQDDYTFSTSKTNGAGRFSLSVKMMPKLPTDVENIKQGNVWATTQDNNIVVNGLTKDMQLWIYDATGKLLHADRTTNYQHGYSVPQTGAYFVRVHDKNDAQTIKVVVE